MIHRNDFPLLAHWLAQHIFPGHWLTLGLPQTTKRNVAGNSSPSSAWISFLTSEHVLSKNVADFSTSVNLVSFHPWTQWTPWLMKSSKWHLRSRSFPQRDQLSFDVLFISTINIRYSNERYNWMITMCMYNIRLTFLKFEAVTACLSILRRYTLWVVTSVFIAQRTLLSGASSTFSK